MQPNQRARDYGNVAAGKEQRPLPATNAVISYVCANVVRIENRSYCTVPLLWRTGKQDVPEAVHVVVVVTLVL